MIAAVLLIRCVNCGGTSWPTVLALVFSGASAIAAARSLLIQTAEQKRLRTELAKRADFDITIRPMGDPFTSVTSDSAELVSDASGTMLRFEVGVSNTGQKAAAHTVLNFLAPSRYSGLKWCDPNGEDLDVPRDAPLTSEQLSGPIDPHGSRWITAEIDRVALRTPRVRFAMFYVELPSDGHHDVHVRAKAQSDELPDDVVERITDYVVHIRPH